MIGIRKIKRRLDKDKIIVLIGGWTEPASLFYLIRESIPKEYGYIQYIYPDRILCPNPIRTRKNFHQLINKITKDLTKLENKKPRSVYLYGQSTGGLFCMIVSDKIQTEKVMLIVPGYNIAEAFWLGESTQDLKNKMVKRYKMTLSKLKREWETISPDHYFKNKSFNTDYNIILSKIDVVIPVANGEKLIKLLMEENIKVHLSWTHLSHRIEIIREGLFINHFKNWISSIK